MPATTQPPQRPGPVRLRRTKPGRYPIYETPDRRFLVTRLRPDADTPYEDSGFEVRDTSQRNVLGHAHTNRVRVFEMDDVTAVIYRVLVVEWLGKLQRFEDAERRAAGLPTLVEELQTRRTGRVHAERVQR